MAKRIVIVEDHQEIIDLVTEFLSDEGFLVDSESNPIEGIRKIKRHPPDLVLLDLRMPEMDGLTVCETLKKDPGTAHVPIIMISVKSRESDVILGLEKGADDYVRKPIQLGELLARVKAVLRRRAPLASSHAIVVGALRIDSEAHTATINGEPLTLRPKEFALLRYFAEREGRVVTRAYLSEHVWDRNHIPTSHTIEYHVYELRKKLGRHGHWIQSLKGVGYRFDTGEESPEDGK